jgi:energy-coupling factor transporter transmembrane protein EcfT
MKKFAFYALQVLVNILLIGLAVGLFLYFLIPYAKHTIIPVNFIEILTILLLLIFLPLFSLKRFGLIRYVNFGISSLLVVGVLFLIFFINYEFNVSKYKRQYPVEEVIPLGQKSKLGVYIYEKSGRAHFECENNDCTRMDSVKVTILTGVLGFPVISKELETMKKVSCL